MTHQPGRRINVPAVVAFYLVLGLTGWGLSRWVGTGDLVTLRGLEVAPPAVSVGVGAAFGLLIVGMDRWMERRFSWARRLSARMRALIGTLRSSDAAWMSMSSSIGEELLFRGFLLPAVAMLWTGIRMDVALSSAQPDPVGWVIGAGVSGVVFGLAHVGPGRDFLPWTVSAILLGFALAALAIATGSVLAPIVAHLTINWFNLLALGRADRGEAGG